MSGNDGQIAAPRANLFDGSHNIRTVVIEGEPWFVARDVAKVLGYAKPRNAVAMHCVGSAKQGIPTTSGVQNITIIPESDVYRLIMRSKLPSAERFEEWVVGEVLPAIRRTGGYIVAAPAETPEEILAKARVIANETLARHAARLQAAETKVGVLEGTVEGVEARIC